LITIIENDSLINKILGMQNITDSKYRWSCFTVVVKHNDMILLYNTLTSEEIAISESIYKSVVDETKHEIYNTLIKKWFLVPIDFNEQELYNSVFATAGLFVKKNGITNYIIMTTTDCNARCFYCFEKDVKKYSMSKKTAVDVADFIMKKSLGQKVQIQWFGGEPLYNREAIDTICNRLKNNNINFNSIMITNGYLIDPLSISKDVRLWNLKRVQITLDGTEKIYNRCKNYIYESGVNPFLKVVKNIEALLKEKIKVSIRLNLDKHNKEDLFSLVDFLNDVFIDYVEYINVYVCLLYDDRGIKTMTSDAQTRKDGYEQLIKLENYIHYKKLSSKSYPPKRMRLFACMADMENSTTILPDGNLGKCDHMLKDEFWGNIYSDSVNVDNFKKWQEYRSTLTLCNSCPMLPNCLSVKNCPDNGKYDCDEQIMERKIEKLKKSMINAYDNFNKSNMGE